jgi:hypothetical protein
VLSRECDLLIEGVPAQRNRPDIAESRAGVIELELGDREFADEVEIPLE